jgi:periplasmic mercuric ion binding protein
MKKLFSFLAVVLVLISTLAQATQSLKAQVNGMVCAFCAQGIEKKLRALGQTKDVYVNLKQKIVAVEIKDGQSLSHEAFAALIKDAGYDVTAVETVEKSAREIKAETRKP